MDWVLIAGALISVLIVLLVFAIVAGPGFLLERRRREVLEGFCSNRGYKLTGTRPSAEADADIVPWFRIGSRRQWRYQIEGEHLGSRFSAFEFRSSTYGNSFRDVQYTALMRCEFDSVVLPEFNVTPRGVVARLAGKLGDPRVEFADDPEFSKAYAVSTLNEGAVRNLLTKEARAQLASDSGQHVATGRSKLYWYRSGRLPLPPALDAFIDEGQRLRLVLVPV